MTASPIRCVAVMGATATGKTELGISIALAVGGEVVSMDSRQVYRGFDIGTAKVTASDRARVAHHLIDTLEPTDASTAGRHAALARRAARDIAARGGVPVFVGGTGLYFRALFRGLAPVAIPRDAQERIRAGFAGRDTRSLYDELARRDPERAHALSPNDRVRITRALEIIEHTGTPASRALARRDPDAGGFMYLKLILTMPRAVLRERIEARTRALFDAGWPAEVARLLDAGVPLDAPAMNSLGYREIAGALRARVDPRTRVDRVVTETRQYAKRQETFFRSEGDAVRIDVTAPGAEAGVHRLVREFLAGPARSASQ